MHDGKIKFRGKFAQPLQVLIRYRPLAIGPAPAFTRRQPQPLRDRPGSLHTGRNWNLQLRCKRRFPSSRVDQSNLIRGFINQRSRDVQAQSRGFARSFDRRESNPPYRPRFAPEKQLLHQRADLFVSDRKCSERLRLGRCLDAQRGSAPLRAGLLLRRFS